MPEVSIIIPTWNSATVIRTCLGHLTQQTFQDFEVVIVDNASSDGSVKDLKEKWSTLIIQIENLEVNKGFAVANNIGAHLARGPWLALLNADAFPAPDWLEKLLHAAEKNSDFSSFSSRQIQAKAKDLLDGAGDAYHITGLAWRRYYNKSVHEYGLDFKDVFSACPAAALYSRDSFLQAGGFDEDYFSYFEDVDLGFRLRLNGKKCLYVPDAVVHHMGSASTGKRSDFSVYHGYRNMIWTFIKNMPSPLIWIFLPLHLSAILFFAFYLTVRGQGRAIWKAIFDALVGLPKMIEKRKVIQKNKRTKSVDLLNVMSTGLLEPFQEFRQRNRQL